MIFTLVLMMMWGSLMYFCSTKKYHRMALVCAVLAGYEACKLLWIVEHAVARVANY